MSVTIKLGIFTCPDNLTLVFRVDIDRTALQFLWPLSVEDPLAYPAILSLTYQTSQTSHVNIGLWQLWSRFVIVPIVAVAFCEDVVIAVLVFDSRLRCNAVVVWLFRGAKMGVADFHARADPRHAGVSGVESGSKYTMLH